MITILGIESSCDDTSAAVIRDGVILSNVIAGQAVHERYGGVVPELASRAHQQNIIPVVHDALKQAGVLKEEISAVAFTRGPGLLGSLLVGTSFAKGFSSALNIPMIEVNHLQAHVLAHFIKEDKDDLNQPAFPFLCLLVSGGNSQIILVKNYDNMEIIGKTIDDAAGEAFDLGYNLSLVLKENEKFKNEELTFIVHEELTKLLNDNITTHPELGDYICLSNIGILFEKELKINILQTFQRLSKNTLLILAN
jgi:glycoprotease/Kae1 family metallohydrolase